MNNQIDSNKKNKGDESSRLNYVKNNGSLAAFIDRLSKIERHTMKNRLISAKKKRVPRELEQNSWRKTTRNRMKRGAVWHKRKTGGLAVSMFSANNCQGP
jgi:hypothetical protein